MNNLEEAAFLTEHSWCAGSLKKTAANDDDKFCAVGALAQAIDQNLINNWYDLDVMQRTHVVNTQVNPYVAIRESVEGKALAEEIMESDWLKAQVAEVRYSIEDFYKEGVYESVIIMFNDEQETNEPVVEMMKRASKRLS